MKIGLFKSIKAKLNDFIISELTDFLSLLLEQYLDFEKDNIQSSYDILSHRVL